MQEIVEEQAKSRDVGRERFYYTRIVDEHKKEQEWEELKRKGVIRLEPKKPKDWHRLDADEEEAKVR